MSTFFCVPFIPLSYFTPGILYNSSHSRYCAGCFCECEFLWLLPEILSSSRQHCTALGHPCSACPSLFCSQSTYTLLVLPSETFLHRNPSASPAVCMGCVRWFGSQSALKIYFPSCLSRLRLRAPGTWASSTSPQLLPSLQVLRHILRNVTLPV